MARCVHTPRQRFPDLKNEAGPHTMEIMSQQQSFEFDDLDVRSESAGQKKSQPSIRGPLLSEDRPTDALDPRVAPTQEVVAAVFGAIHERRFSVRYWDGTFEPAGACSTPEFALSFERPGSLRRMLLPPSELSIVEAFLSGDVNIEGHLEAAMSLGDDIGNRVQSGKAFAQLLPKLIALPRDDSSAPRQVKGTRFSRGIKRLLPTWRHGDEKAIQYHYDVSNDFYRLWLDSRMVYTCAYFNHAEDDLDTAQVSKLDHICRKLRLEPGMKFLDVGCGWGALIMHAAQNYGVDAVGITLSEAQATLARQHIAAAGLSDRCRVEIRDYRDLQEKARVRSRSVRRDDGACAGGSPARVLRRRLQSAQARRAVHESHHRECVARAPRYPGRSCESAALEARRLHLKVCLPRGKAGLGIARDREAEQSRFRAARCREPA